MCSKEKVIHDSLFIKYAKEKDFVPAAVRAWFHRSVEKDTDESLRTFFDALDISYATNIILDHIRYNRMADDLLTWLDKVKIEPETMEE